MANICIIKNGSSLRLCPEQTTEVYLEGSEIPVSNGLFVDVYVRASRQFEDGVWDSQGRLAGGIAAVFEDSAQCLDEEIGRYSPTTQALAAVGVGVTGLFAGIPFMGMDIVKAGARQLPRGGLSRATAAMVMELGHGVVGGIQFVGDVISQDIEGGSGDESVFRTVLTHTQAAGAAYFLGRGAQLIAKGGGNMMNGGGEVLVSAQEVAVASSADAIGSGVGDIGRGLVWMSAAKPKVIKVTVDDVERVFDGRSLDTQSPQVNAMLASLKNIYITLKESLESLHQKLKKDEIDPKEAFKLMHQSYQQSRENARRLFLLQARHVKRTSNARWGLESELVSVFIETINRSYERLVDKKGDLPRELSQILDRKLSYGRGIVQSEYLDKTIEYPRRGVERLMGVLEDIDATKTYAKVIRGKDVSHSKVFEALRCAYYNLKDVLGVEQTSNQPAIDSLDQFGRLLEVAVRMDIASIMDEGMGLGSFRKFPFVKHLAGDQFLYLGDLYNSAWRIGDFKTVSPIICRILESAPKLTGVQLPTDAALLLQKVKSKIINLN